MQQNQALHKLPRYLHTASHTYADLRNLTVVQLYLINMSSSVAASFPPSTCKASNNCGQSFEDLGPDFFDQFLTFDAVDNESPDYSILPGTFTDGLDGPIEDIRPRETSLGCIDDAINNANAAQGEPGAILHDTASLHFDLGNRFYAEASGRAALSDPELLSLKSITLDSPKVGAHPRTSPSSPSSKFASSLPRRSKIAESLSKTFKRTAAALDNSFLRSPIRKSSTPAQMLRISHSNHSQQNLLGCKLSQDSVKFNFNLDLDQHILPLSPPPSAKVSDASEHSTSRTRGWGRLSNGFTHQIPMPQQGVPNTFYDTPMATPKLEQHPTPRALFRGAPADSSPFPVTPRNQHTSGTWNRVPSGGFQPFETPHSYPAPEMEGALWWNHAAAAPMAQPSPSGLNNNLQRATKSLAMQLQNGLHYSANELAFDPLNMTNGLMIQMPDAPVQQSFVMGGLPPQQQGYFASTHSQPHHHRDRAERKRFLARPRHPQPSPTRKSRHQNHSSDSESPSPNSSRLHVRKRRSPKGSKGGKTPTTPGVVDFVNYTPDDSRKILTGVAPSGSSKTKARREKEALEKRRKLSQAAVRAVRAAGGDVESLVEQGLLV